MRRLISALCLTFALAGFIAAPAMGCELYKGKKMSDFETPPPVTTTSSTTEQKGS
jgi:hypothetical protein